MKSQAAIQNNWQQLIIRRAVLRFLRMMRPKERQPICNWVQERVDLKYDATSAAAGKIELYPYQVEPLMATEDPNVQQVTLEWAPRLGKSTIWKMSMLKRLADGGLSGLIVYPTMEMGVKTNKDTVQPLMMTLPEARRDLATRGGKLKDSYHIPSLQSVIYFLGGGSQVISYTANWCVVDEADRIQIAKSGAEGENTDQIKAVRLRMQTFKERMLIVCSSPTLYSGSIHEEFMTGSRGEWNLRCLNCGALTTAKQIAFPMQDGTYAGLQWQKDERGMVVEDSIRWICPHCRHEHVEADAKEMSRRGAYVHAVNSNTRHRSYQCSALGNPWIWSWREIAERQEMATNPDAKKDFANNVMGVPYKHRREGDISVNIDQVIRSKMVDYPADLKERLAVVCAGVDQQKNELAGQKYFPWVVRGWDEDGNSWLLGTGTDNTLEALRAHLTQTYFGHNVMLAAIDQGGFGNTDDMDPFIASLKNAVYYKGDDDKTLKGRNWMPSQTQHSLFLAHAIRYQIKLLSLMYDPPRPVGYKWLLPVDAPADYLTQIANVGPNNRILKDGNGQLYQNWCATGTNRRDFFDAEKMCLVALDLAFHYAQPLAFAHRNKPKFLRLEVLNELRRKGQLT